MSSFELFCRLADDWRHDRFPGVNVATMVMHPSYQRINGPESCQANVSEMANVWIEWRSVEKVWPVSTTALPTLG